MISRLALAEQQTLHVDPESLMATNRCLIVDGAGDDAAYSIHLVFAPSRGDSAERFHCDHPDGELLAINGVLDSSLLVRLLAEVLEEKTITLKVREATESVSRISYSRELDSKNVESLDSTKSVYERSGS